MSRILAISSQVARGHVGLSAIVPALQRMDYDVVALPTVLLSNHPGHARCSGEPIGPDVLAGMLAVLEENGWLDEIDAVLTGYLPSWPHVRFAAEAVARVRATRPRALVLCDPVLGDDPKGLYIDRAAAVAVREDLLPLADLVTPNRFELAWLAERPVDGVASAIDAAQALTGAATLATSVPAHTRLANLLATGTQACVCHVARREHAPHGVGDLFSALVLGHHLASAPLEEALARASAGVEKALAASEGCAELVLVAALARIVGAAPLPLEPVM